MEVFIKHVDADVLPRLGIKKVDYKKELIQKFLRNFHSQKIYELRGM
jgi:hypothetical protein